MTVDGVPSMTTPTQKRRGRSVSWCSVVSAEGLTSPDSVLATPTPLQETVIREEQQLVAAPPQLKRAYSLPPVEDDGSADELVPSWVAAIRAFREDSMNSNNNAGLFEKHAELLAQCAAPRAAHTHTFARALYSACYLMSFAGSGRSAQRPTR